MNIIFLTIIISLIIGVFFLFLFLHLVKTGQYDDVYSPSVRMLFDDELVKEKTENINDNKTINN